MYEKIKNGESLEGDNLEMDIQVAGAVAKIIGTVVGGSVTGDWSAAHFSS